jgi:hypothetical protein
MALGIIGEYVGRTYMEAKQRPLYVVAEKSGFEAPVVSRLPRRSAPGSPVAELNTGYAARAD